jgi:phosphoribosylamine--glycine ligase
MKILVIGSGGREHAIVDALNESAQKQKLEILAAPGNGGIQSQAKAVPIRVDDVPGLVEFARQNSVDLTFVGPETPLALGVVDAFGKHGLRIIGPTADLARLESSKGFAKRFFKTYGIPTADFEECSTAKEAYAVLERARLPIVVKADGLAAGKGVVVAETMEEARSAVKSFMEAGTLGEAGARVVIEEFLSGEEASLLSFADGPAFQPMAVAQDHKRRFDGDRGPNTGGMGAYSTDTILTAAQRQAALDKIIRPTLENAKTYNGILYAGLMLTAAGPKIIEYNVRFGDPETQVILPRLKTDLVDVFTAMTEGRLNEMTLSWREGAAATVVLVADGYPGKYEQGKRITGLDEAGRMEGVKVYHAGTTAQDGAIYTAGGRVLNVTAVGNTLRQALDRAYAAAERIQFEGKDYRKDIGRKGLEKNA